MGSLVNWSLLEDSLLSLGRRRVIDKIEPELRWLRSHEQQVVQ
jgi:hypothetical protein